MREPLVSVCIPVYRHARFLRTAVESLLAQSLQDFDLSVSDDASPDARETEAILRDYSDPRIRFHQQSRHGGVASNRDACLQLARGRYVAWLDADDIYEPDALERLARVLESHPDAAFAHGAFNLIDESGGSLKASSGGPPADTVECSAAAVRELAACNYVTTSTVLVRRSVQEAAGGFDRTIGRSSTDWNMWLRLAHFGDVAYLREPVARYRLHADTISAQTGATDERLHCDVRAVLHALDGGCTSSPERSQARAIAKAGLAFRWLIQVQMAFRAGNTRRALHAILEAFRQAREHASTDTWRSLASLVSRRDEYGLHQACRTIMGSLYTMLAGTRYGEQVRKLAVPDPAWDAEVIECASAIKLATEPGSLVAAIDKHDPSLLHFSGRDGVHFPEAGAYPRDASEAISMLTTLREQGIHYLAIPAFSFWWLDFYRDFATHLQTHYTSTWDDSRCKVYELR